MPVSPRADADTWPRRADEAPIRVLVVDDHAILRRGLRLLIDGASGLTVVGEAADGQEALAAVATMQPDVVLMDLAMPVMDGLAATRAIHATHPRTRVLVLTMYDDDEHPRQALQAGAAGYMVKQAVDVEVLDAIRHVAAGGVFIRPALTDDLVRACMDRFMQRDDPELLDCLSRRERQVMAMVAQGHTNTQIADALVLSVRTIESHRASLMEKLGLRTRAQLVQHAVRHGLLD